MTREKVYLSADTSSPSEKVLKITTKGVPLSVDDAEILKMLGKFEVSLSSPIRNENIRNPTTRKMSCILNENSGFSQVLTICMYMKCTRFSIIRWMIFWLSGHPSQHFVSGKLQISSYSTRTLF